MTSSPTLLGGFLPSRLSHMPIVCRVSAGVIMSPKGGYALQWPIQGGSALKGYLFQHASGVFKQQNTLSMV